MTIQPRHLGITFAAAVILLLAGCYGDDSSTDTDSNNESQPATQTAPDSSSQAAVEHTDPTCLTCGTIIAIDKRQTEGNTGAIVGTVVGAVAGLVVGNQIGGGGTGTDIAQVVGGLGGAAAGHEIGERIDNKAYYAVSIRMESGGTNVINVPSAAGLSVGQKVHVSGGNIVLQ